MPSDTQQRFALLTMVLSVVSLGLLIGPAVEYENGTIAVVVVLLLVMVAGSGYMVVKYRK